MASVSVHGNRNAQMEVHYTLHARFCCT